MIKLIAVDMDGTFLNSQSKYNEVRKTSSRVRMGLYLAWKASLAIRMCRSPSL